MVIIALSAFDGMNLDQHKDLIQFLICTFDNKICPNHVSSFISSNFLLNASRSEIAYCLGGTVFGLKIMSWPLKKFVRYSMKLNMGHMNEIQSYSDAAYVSVISLLFLLFQIIPSLRQCWKHNYQVILSYDDSAASGYEELWPQCEYWWANTSDPSHVISYLEERKAEGRPGR